MRPGGFVFAQISAPSIHRFFYSSPFLAPLGPQPAQSSKTIPLISMPSNTITLWEKSRIQAMCGYNPILVSVTLKDQTGAIVDNRQGSPWLKHLPPQAAIGFDVIEPDPAKSALIRSYSIALTYSSGPQRPTSLDIDDVTSSRNSVGWLQVQGVVANGGDFASDNTSVTGTFYGLTAKSFSSRSRPPQHPRSRQVRANHSH